MTGWSGSPSVTGVFAKAPESGSSFWIRMLVTSCVTSELGNRAHCAVPGQALRAVSTCGVIANGVRHGERWTAQDNHRTTSVHLSAHLEEAAHRPLSPTRTTLSWGSALPHTTPEDWAGDSYRASEATAIRRWCHSPHATFHGSSVLAISVRNRTIRPLRRSRRSRPSCPTDMIAARG